MPGGVVSAAAMEANSKAQKPAEGRTATAALGDVRIERNGEQRWLVIKRPADQLWEPVRDFWLENGFIFTTEDRQLGIIETDWAENRAKIPQDVIRKTLGKVFDGLYSTSERDRFRTRLERSADGSTEVYITHRGMQEVYTSAQKDQTIWQPRLRSGTGNRIPAPPDGQARREPGAGRRRGQGQHHHGSRHRQRAHGIRQRTARAADRRRL